MPRISITDFMGLNVQPGGDLALGTLQVGTNVELVSLGDGKRHGIRRRPVLRYRAALPSESAGLYTIANRPHTAAPTGTTITGLLPTISVDLLSTTGSANVDEVHGVVANAANRPLILLKTAGPTTELHLAESPDVAPSGTTRITDLPFTPILGGLAKIAARAYCLDGGAGARLLRYSAIDESADLLRLREWDPNADPDDVSKSGGFLEIGGQDGIGGTAIAVAEYQGRIIVLFQNAVQIWRVGGDPSTDAILEQTIRGPGVLDDWAVVGANQDSAYPTPGLGLQTLSAAQNTLNANEDNIGTPIEPLIAETYNAGATSPRLFYSRVRGQLMLLMGDRIFVFLLRPGEGRSSGWTLWQFPAGIDFNGICEAGREVFLRSGDVLYSLDDEEDNGDEVTDGVYTPVDVRVDLNEIGQDSPTIKQLVRVGAIVTEDTVMQIARDGRPALSQDGTIPVGTGTRITLSGRAPEVSSTNPNWTARTFGVRFQADSAPSTWRLDAVFVDYRDLGNDGVQ